MSYRVFIFSFALLWCSSIFSQNLVPDPGFEDWNGTIGINPNTLGGLNLWYEVNGTPDHHHQLNPPGSNLTSLEPCPLGNGQNQCGEPWEGQAVLGTYKANSIDGTKEWSAIELTSPLDPDFCYNVEFYIQNKKDNPSFIMETNQWGVFFSNTPAPTFDPNTLDFSTVTNQYVATDQLINDTIWHHIELTYTPDDTYSYIYVGYMGNVVDAAENAWSMAASVGFYVWMDSIVVSPASVPFLDLIEDQTICEGDSVLLYGDSNLPITWDGGIVGDSIWVSPTTTTTYAPVAGAGSPICSIEDYVTVTVNDCNCPIPIQGDATGVNNTECNSSTMCNGSVTANPITGVPPFLFQWDDPAGQITQTAFDLCPGFYTCTITDADNCDVEVTYEVTGLTDADVTLIPSSETCEGIADGSIDVIVNAGEEPFEYLWSNYEVDVPLTGLSAGNYALQITDTFGCMFIFNTIVDLDENQIIDLNYPNDICADASPVQLDSTLIDGIWTGDGIIDPSQGTFNPSIVGPGIYQLQYEPNNGCGTIYVMNVVVVAPPFADFTFDVALGCAPLEVAFSSTDLSAGNTYAWEFGDGNISDLGAPTNSYFNEGLYTVNLLLTDANGCSAFSVQNNAIDVIGQPLADFTFSPNELSAIENQLFLTDRSIGASTWHWDFGNGATASSQNVATTYPGPGNYTITLSIESGDNCSSEISYDIIYTDEVFIYVPNSFSPNQDGLNDYFQVISVNKLKTYELKIYDRWGIPVFQSEDLSDRWDGSHELNENYYVNETIYNYEITYSTDDLNSEKIFGSILLIR